MAGIWYFGEVNEASRIEVKGDVIVMSNSLIRREISLRYGTVAYEDNYHKFIRACCYDGYAVVDGKTYFLYKDLKFKSFEITQPVSRLQFIPSGKESEVYPYPPKGKAVRIEFENEVLTAWVVYEIYDGIPATGKSLEFVAKRDCRLNKYAVEYLDLTEDGKKYLYAESDYNGGDMYNNNRRISVKNIDDGDEKKLEVGFEEDFEYRCLRGETFEGMKVYELGLSSDYYEYRTLEIKHMYRKIMPWVLDCPLFFHLISDSNFGIKRAIRDAERAGFDMIIQSFGSGVDMQKKSRRYVDRHRKLYDYAHSKGIRIGGYTLAIVKNYKAVNSDECNVYADPETRIYRCLASKWSQEYWRSIFDFCDKTGADAIEIDGPYHFLKCRGGKSHLHEGLHDSRYLQWKLSTVEVFSEFRRRGIYVHAPDWLFMSGNNKCGIGYEEIAFSAPRQEQILLTRLYNYNGTFGKIPSMGWSFLPISVYHGGGRQARFAPLEKNIEDFDWMVFQHFVAGVMPCFRGKKLIYGRKSYDVLRKHTEFYKKYKYVLNGYTIHFMPPKIDYGNPCRATDIDAVLTVREDGDCRGILAVFNQTDRRITKTIEVPLYYTALCGALPRPAPKPGTHICDVKPIIYGKYPPSVPVYEDEDADKVDPVSGFSGAVKLPRENYPTVTDIVKTEYSAEVAREDKDAETYAIYSDCNIRLTVDLAPMSYTWYTVRKPSAD